MTRLCLTGSDSLNVYRNQAIERWLLDHLEDDMVILYLWRNDHTVVIGRNQDAYAECDLERLEKDGGRLARRISGGGAVYHDAGNLNFTFLAKREDFDVTVQDQVILDALDLLGIRAVKNGRNDLEIDGRKFSGHAYYRGKENCLHHGTLMLEVDEESLSKYLHVSILKLHSKSVSSVRSRIINLKSVRADLEIDDLKKSLIASFEKRYGGKVQEFPFDEDEVLKLEKDFEDPSWRYGRRNEHRLNREKRFEWGTVKIAYDEEDGVLKALDIYTDALHYEANEEEIEDLLGRRIKEIETDGKSEQLAQIIGLLKEE